MGGGSGNLNDLMGNYGDENDKLTKMQEHLSSNARNLLNQEMVRSSTTFGFGDRPEPVPIVTDKDMDPDPKFPGVPDIFGGSNDTGSGARQPNS